MKNDNLLLYGLAIDPGSSSSAAVFFSVANDRWPEPWGILPIWAEEFTNAALLGHLRDGKSSPWVNGSQVLVIETMVSIFVRDGFRSGAIARDQMEAERWGARFKEAFLRTTSLPEHSALEIARASARAATIGQASGGDPQVRRALIDAYGGDAVAFGRKCGACKGKGWKGAGRPVCETCGGNGWEVPPGPLYGWSGSHVFAALACAFAAFRPGGAYDKRNP